jgi:hypothetical protein
MLRQGKKTVTTSGPGDWLIRQIVRLQNKRLLAKKESFPNPQKMPDMIFGSKPAMFLKNIIDRKRDIKVHNNSSNISYSTKKGRLPWRMKF